MATGGPRPGAPGSRAPSPRPPPQVPRAVRANRTRSSPPEERKAAMSGLDPLEQKLARWALTLAAAAALGAAIYINSANKVTKAGKNSIAVAPDAWLLTGVILLMCVLGGLALWKNKRTFVTFALFLIGFAFTLPFGLIGLVFILLGGWFMLRAWRINRYGTTNSKLIAREAANRPRGRDRTRPRRREPSPRHRQVHENRPRPASATRPRRHLARRSRSRPSSPSLWVDPRSEPRQPGRRRNARVAGLINGLVRSTEPSAAVAAHRRDDAPTTGRLALLPEPGAPRPRSPCRSRWSK